MSNDASHSTNELPIACNLSESEQQERREALASGIYKNFEQVDELATAMRFVIRAARSGPRASWSSSRSRENIFLERLLFYRLGSVCIELHKWCL